MRLGFLNEIRGKKKAELIGEIKTETVNTPALFGRGLRNQFFLLVLKWFCQKKKKKKPDTVTDFLFFWFIRSSLTQPLLVQQSNVWGTLLQNGDIAV